MSPKAGSSTLPFEWLRSHVAKSKQRFRSDRLGILVSRGRSNMINRYFGRVTMSATGGSKNWQQRYMERWYSRGQGWLDGTSLFHAECQSVLNDPSLILLEIGSGPPNKSSCFLANLGQLVGVDIDPVVKTNTALKDAVVLTDETLPFPEDSFSGCFSNWVIEHVEDPLKHLEEVRRVLAPGGWYVFRTPNRFHYVSAVASLTPQWLHKVLANRLRNLPTDAHEPWKTFYRLNTRRAVKRSAALGGLEVHKLLMFEPEPCYGMSSRGLFLIFMAYERLVNASSLFQDFRHTMVVVLRKPPRPLALGVYEASGSVIARSG